MDDEEMCYVILKPTGTKLENVVAEDAKLLAETDGYEYPEEAAEHICNAVNKALEHVNAFLMDDLGWGAIVTTQDNPLVAKLLEQRAKI